MELPSNNLAISAHRFPRVWCASKITLSSNSAQLSLRISGFRWLCHLKCDANIHHMFSNKRTLKKHSNLSRHCFPMRPGRQLDMSDHFFAPWVFTRSMTFASSSAVHGPLTSSGFNTCVWQQKHIIRRPILNIQAKHAPSAIDANTELLCDQQMIQISFSSFCKEKDKISGRASNS